MILGARANRITNGILVVMCAVALIVVVTRHTAAT